MICEVSPFRLATSGVALIAPEADVTDPTNLDASGVTTLPMSLDQAMSRAEEQLLAVKRAVKEGNHQPLVNLLDDHPEFSAHPWVQNQLVKWRSTGRSYRKRGRTRGSFEWHPLVIVAVVRALKQRNLATSNEDAFEWLVDNWGIRYETVRYQYYRAWREHRFRAVLFQTPFWRIQHTPEEYKQMLAEAEPLEPGKSITRKLADFPEGPLTVTFEGL